MIELLNVLANWLGFFFKENRYRLVNSQSGSSFDDAFVIMASDRMRWRLINDRSQIFLDCQPARASQDKEREWHSSDLLIRLLTGERVESAELTEDMAQWIEANLGDIEARFTENRLEQTTRDLKKLEKLRAKEMFG